jgi:hypothetical protein
MAAEMVELPELTPVDTPRELTIATEGVDELQFTWPVISRLDPSLKVPVAANGWLAPTATEAGEGVSAIDTSVALLTVSVAVPTFPENTAEIVLVPDCTPVACPAVLTALLIVAAAEFEDVQFTTVVRS